MKVMLQRLSAIALVMILLLAALPMNALAQGNNAEIDWDTYVQNNKKVFATAKSAAWDEEFQDMINSAPDATYSLRRSSESVDDTERYVVLAIDVSGSMYGEPLSAMKVAARRFCEQVLNTTTNTHLAITTYTGSSSTLCGFTRDLTVLTNVISGLTDQGMTNHHAGLTESDELLQTITKAGVVKDIVIMSDGLPNQGPYNYQGAYTYNDYYDYEYANAALQYAQQLHDSYTIYSLGFFHSLYGSDLIFGRRFMKDLANGGYWEVTDPDELEFTFDDIADTIVGAKTGQFKYAGFINKKYDSTATYFYSDAYFNGDATDFNSHLATMSLCLELSAWSSWNTNNWPDKTQNACALLSDIGFLGYKQNDAWDQKPSMHSLGAVAAYKNIKDTTVVALAVRGGGYYDEWGGNFVLGSSGNHSGFEKGQLEAIRFLTSYIHEHKNDFKSELKLWIVGFSRGGAVANMAAGYLTDKGSCDDMDLDAKNIFAYTFEAPQGYVGLNASGYKNIHNLINTMDIVPYVAPSVMGFRRYNTNSSMIFPTLATKSYNQKVEAIQAQFAKVRAGIPSSGIKMDDATINFDPNPYAMKIDLGIDISAEAGFKKWKLKFLGLSGYYPYIDIDADLHWKSRDKNLPVDRMLTGSVNSIFSGIPGGRVGYVNNVENALSNLCTFFMGYNNKIDWSAVLDEAFFANYAEGARKIFGITLNPFLSPIQKIADASAASTKLIADAALKQTGTNIDELTSALTSLLTAVFSATIDDPQQVFGFLYYLIGDNGFQSHWPEISLAAMMANDEYYTNEASFKQDYPHSYRIVLINCPVDVAVYDENGQLMSQIKGENVTNMSEVHGSSITESGSKQVVLPSDVAYNIQISATGNGEMSVSVLEYDSMLQQHTLLQGYQNVPINTGDTFQAIIPEFTTEDYRDPEGDGSTSPYKLIGPNGKTIAPTIQLTGSNVKYYQVTLSSNNQKGVVTGGGQFITSSFAQVQAVGMPTVDFFGWYIDGKCVSTNETYRFPVNKDMHLVAQFSEGNFHKLLVKATKGGKVNLREIDLPETVEIQLHAEPEDGFKFVGWEATAGQVQSAQATTTLFTMPASDATVTAIFENTNALTITQQPTDQFVVVGQRATFSIAATGKNVTYQWYINRNNGRGWRELDDAIVTAYTTTVVDLECDGFQYACHVKDDNTPDGIRSNTAVLHVSNEPIIPDTGDHSTPVLYTVTMLLGGLGFFMLRKKRNVNEKQK